MAEAGHAEEALARLAGPFTSEMKEIAGRLSRLTFKDMTLLGAMVAGHLAMSIEAETKALSGRAVGIVPAGTAGVPLEDCVVRALLSVADSIAEGKCTLVEFTKTGGRHR